jgi:ankyrin repeat protein
MRDAVIAGDVAKAEKLIQTHPGLINSTDGNNSNTTPLHLAAWYGRTEFAAWLLGRQASVNAVNRYGNTPLHLAAGQGHKKIVLMLLERNPTLNVKNEEGCTPLDYAIAYDEITNILREHGAEDDPETISPAP